MTRTTLISVAVTAALMTGAGAPQAAETLAQAISEGDAGLDLRYRLELVDDDAFDEDAEASTLRLRLNYLTADWNGWQAFAEFDYLAEVGLDDFNSGAGTSGPDRAQYPVVADPNGEDLNQLWVQKSFGQDSKVRVGRQRILLDNQRFVGGVGWRQNEQTYDAASLDLGLGGGRVFYAYVDNVNRIFGNEVPAGDNDSETHLLNGSWSIGETGKLTGYGYFIDNEDVPAFSTDTIGLRYVGKTSFGERSFDYLAEYATQDDAANNPVDYDADYYRLEGTVGFDPLKLGLGYEVLGGGDTAGAAFQTPLATGHAFNGWADRFLSTPDAGLEDLFVTAGGKLGAWGWKAIWHEFETEEGGVDLGSELDASIGRKFGDQNRYSVLFKLAAFDGDTLPDTTKGWLMLTASF